MHEVALVRAIIETVEDQAVAQNAKQVKWVRIRFNSLTSHSADHVRFGFDIVKKDSPLVRNATLKLDEVAPLLRCKQCNHVFPGHHLPDVCPGCGSVDVLAVNSTDMVLDGFEIEK